MRTRLLFAPPLGADEGAVAATCAEATWRGPRKGSSSSSCRHGRSGDASRHETAALIGERTCALSPERRATERGAAAATAAATSGAAAANANANTGGAPRLAATMPAVIQPLDQLERKADAERLLQHHQHFQPLGHLKVVSTTWTAPRESPGSTASLSLRSMAPLEEEIPEPIATSAAMDVSTPCCSKA